VLKTWDELLVIAFRALARKLMTWHCNDLVPTAISLKGNHDGNSIDASRIVEM
jgi:hypothetical protein